MNKIETIIVYDESKSDVKDFFANKVSEQANNRIELCHELGYEDLSNFNQYALPHLVLILLYPTELLSDISNLIENLSKTETNIFVIQCTEIFELHSNQWIHERVIKITKGNIDPDCIAKERSEIIYLDEIANSDITDSEISTYFICLLKKFTSFKEKLKSIEEIDIIKNVKGFTVVDIPSKMHAKEKYICKIKIGKDRTLLNEIITTETENEVIFDRITIGRRMSAELKNSENFKINLINNKTQIIPEDGLAEWIFEVIHQQRGLHTLYIVLSIVYEDGLRDITFQQEINVEVSRNGWQILKLLLPIVIIGFFFANISIDISPTEYKTSHHNPEASNENLIENKNGSIQHVQFDSSTAVNNQMKGLDDKVEIKNEHSYLKVLRNNKAKKLRYKKFFEANKNKLAAMDSIFEGRYYSNIKEFYNAKTKKINLIRSNSEKILFLESFFSDYPAEYNEILPHQKKCTLGEWLDAIIGLYGYPETLENRYKSSTPTAEFNKVWDRFFQAYYDYFGDESASKNEIIKIAKSLGRA